MLEKELDFFIQNQKELVKKYNGKVLAIKEHEIIGIYNTPLEAYTEVQKDHELGTFAIQPCRPGPEAYTITISTQGLFAE